METGNEPAPHILICEDDVNVAELLQEILGHSGYSTDVAHSAAQARTLLDERPYAAMTLDIYLPDLNGVAFFHELRASRKTRHLPIVVVSVIAEETRQGLQGEVFGIEDWLSKPIDLERLRKAVAQASQRAPGGRARILHVEDDPDILKLVATLLHDIADVRGAPTLQEGKRLLEQELFDLALLDLLLPDGYGLELTPLLNRQKPPVPVIVFSVQSVRRQRDLEKMAAILIKSQTSNADLVRVIKDQIARMNADPANS